MVKVDVHTCGLFRVANDEGPGDNSVPRFIRELVQPTFLHVFLSHLRGDAYTVKGDDNLAGIVCRNPEVSGVNG